MTVHAARLLIFTMLLSLVLSACGGDDDDTGDGGNAETPAAGATMTVATSGDAGQATAGSDGAMTEVSAEPTGAEIPTATPPLVTTQVSNLPPNELGQIPILEYHHIGDEAAQFVRTPDQFRGDLQWLYDNHFYVINLHDFLAGNINVPAGKRPVALTFDDSPSSQFRLLPLDSGQYAIDPNSAIGMMEAFFAAHPDFGRGGHFTVLPDMLFDWTPAVAEPDQTPFAQMKMEWLRDHGYEIGNHTRDHANLAELSADEIMYQLAEANMMIHTILPEVPIEVITLPYGMYPIGPSGPGDDTLFRGFEYQGQQFAWGAALMVGANPTVVPYSTEYDPYAIARIQAFDEELDKWFSLFLSDPGILYVSDGDPNTITVPNDLHPWLVGTLDETKLNGRQLVRY
jgi:peptidoglycan/xylan/chitin deacetylase (PgdA/CDA1 family)